MKVLITGGGGRLGTQIIENLAGNHEFVVVSREDTPPGNHLRAYKIDISAEPDSTADIIAQEKPDAIIHLAALVGGICEAEPELARQINVDATRQLAVTAAANGVGRFIFASTAAVYTQDELEPTDEDHNINPKTVYGTTKLEAEAAITEVSGNTAATRFASLRIFNIYGPGFDKSLVNMLLNAPVESPIQLMGMKTLYRDYIHSQDVAEAVGAALNSDLEPGHTILNIASGTAVNNTELVASLQSGGHNPNYVVKDGANNLNVSWANVDKALNVLGWKSQITLADAVSTGKI